MAIRSDSRIHLMGPRDEMPQWYAAMDLVVLPTYREGFPNVILEAAAMKLPAVATRIPGCADAVDDGETGLLVPPRDPQALAAAIQVYLSDGDLRRRHGEAARNRVLIHFRPEPIWQALYEEYVHLLEGAGVFVNQMSLSRLAS
jgi:glycosyltransferase involved in cell wall biosynthesis